MTPILAERPANSPLPGLVTEALNHGARRPAPGSGPGPAPGLTLAACDAAGCGHLECRRAARANERLTEPWDATGTRRRLQALAFMGHSTAALAARLDVSNHTVRRLQRGNPAEVPAALAAAVAALYDQLWDVRGGSHHAVRETERRGWVPPLGWDDDAEDGHGIDDPASTPADWKPRGGRQPLAGRIEDLALRSRPARAEAAS